MTQEPKLENELAEAHAKADKAVDVGMPIIEDVQLDSLIGRGAFSFVYSGRQRLLDRPVAVKVLAKANPSEESTIERFRQEARITSSLSHPNIIKVLSYGISDAGAPYLVMEYAEGITLEEKLASNTVSLLEFREIFIPLLSALSYAHEAKVVHRDIKPGNIILTVSHDGSLQPKLLDLGLAKIFENEENNQHRTKTGILTGTPAYMSPEQCSQDPVDGRSDIYSLACVMYEYLSGEAPFTGGSALEIMSKKMQGAASSIPQFCQQTGVDAKLAALIFSALDPVPSKRPQSALEFSSQLMAMLQDAELAPLNLRRQKTGLQKKNRTTALILLSAGLLTSAVLLLLVLPNSRNLQKPAESGESHLRPSRSQELAQIEKLKNGTEQQRLSAFFKLQKIIPELEAGEEKIHRKNLGKAYIEIETLINDLAPMKIGPYTPDQLKEMSIDFSNKGCHLALLSGNADWFGQNCNNSFHMLVGNKNGIEIIQSRLAQARKHWPENTEVFRLHALAFQLLLKEKKLNDAAAVLQMASQIPKTGNAHVCSVWIDSMSANLAAQTGEKKESRAAPFVGSRGI